jgi:fructose-bisphosphate aldolase class II
MYKSLRETIQEAEGKKVAIGHFNVSNLEAVHAIVMAGEELGVPIIIGVSESEEKFFGLEEIVSVVQALRTKSTVPIYLNADHHYSFETLKAALDAGFDMAIIDGAAKSFEENVALTKQCVMYADELKVKTGRDILIEAELGFIGQSSKILDEIPEGVTEATMTKSEDAKNFIHETAIDLFAPSVGNIHGIVKGGEPKLHPERVQEIKEAVGIPLVLHGASGNTDEDIQACIRAGISIVHINTEIRIAYKEALEQSVETTKEVAPYKYLEPAQNAVKEVVLKKLKVFNFL